MQIKLLNNKWSEKKPMKLVNNVRRMKQKNNIILNAAKIYYIEVSFLKTFPISCHEKLCVCVCVIKIKRYNVYEIIVSFSEH